MSLDVADLDWKKMSNGHEMVMMNSDSAVSSTTTADDSASSLDSWSTTSNWQQESLKQHQFLPSASALSNIRDIIHLRGLDKDDTNDDGEDYDYDNGADDIFGVCHAVSTDKVSKNLHSQYQQPTSVWQTQRANPVVVAEMDEVDDSSYWDRYDDDEY